MALYITKTNQNLQNDTLAVLNKRKLGRFQLGDTGMFEKGPLVGCLRPWMPLYEPNVAVKKATFALA